jgi:hypothetical protein
LSRSPRHDRPDAPEHFKPSLSHFLRRGMALYQGLTPGILRRKVDYD